MTPDRVLEFSRVRSNVKDLMTINFLQVECWAVHRMKHSLLGLVEIPLSNSYAGRNVIGDFVLSDLHDRNTCIGE